jgi:Arc/MetJ family transcription regulator
LIDTDQQEQKDGRALLGRNLPEVRLLGYSSTSGSGSAILATEQGVFPATAAEYASLCVYFIESIHIAGTTMRTNIVIDDKLMAEALKATGARTKREVVELGLRALVQLKQQERIRGVRGKLRWTGDLERMRTD